MDSKLNRVQTFDSAWEKPEKRGGVLAASSLKEEDASGKSEKTARGTEKDEDAQRLTGSEGVLVYLRGARREQIMKVRRKEVEGNSFVIDYWLCSFSISAPWNSIGVEYWLSLCSNHALCE